MVRDGLYRRHAQFGCEELSHVMGVIVLSGSRTGSEGSDAGVWRNGAFELHI